MKDSSGNWNNTRAILDAIRIRGFDVFGRARILPSPDPADGRRRLNHRHCERQPGRDSQLYRDWKQPDADAQQAALTACARSLRKFPMIPALKPAIAISLANDPVSATVRPPLVALTAEQRRQLLEALNALGFAMPGLAG